MPVPVLAACLAVGRATWVVAMVGAMALGCRDRDPPPSSGPAPVAPAATLIAPGAEPLAPLRYVLTVGTKQRFALTLHLAMRVDAARSPIPPVTAPGLRLVIELAVTEATPTGGARCLLTIEDADLADLDKAMPALVAEMRKGLGKLIGARGRLTIEPDGAVTDLALDVPTTLGNELGQFVVAVELALEQLAMPLPGEPVGVGASWEASEEVEQGGIRARQKTLLELVAREGNRVKLRMQVSGSADRQKAALAGLPPGVTTDIVAFDSAGNGVVEIDLGRPAPVRQRVEVTTGVSFRLVRADETQMMSLSSDSRLELDGL